MRLGLQALPEEFSAKDGESFTFSLRGDPIEAARLWEDELLPRYPQLPFLLVRVADVRATLNSAATAFSAYQKVRRTYKTGVLIRVSSFSLQSPDASLIISLSFFLVVCLFVLPRSRPFSAWARIRCSTRSSTNTVLWPRPTTNAKVRRCCSPSSRNSPADYRRTYTHFIFVTSLPFNSTRYALMCGAPSFPPAQPSATLVSQVTPIRIRRTHSPKISRVRRRWR
jgi:hypothetical protein